MYLMKYSLCNIISYLYLNRYKKTYFIKGNKL